MSGAEAWQPWVKGGKKPGVRLLSSSCSSPSPLLPSFIGIKFL